MVSVDTELKNPNIPEVFASKKHTHTLCAVRFSSRKSSDVLQEGRTTTTPVSPPHKSSERETYIPVGGYDGGPFEGFRRPRGDLSPVRGSGWGALGEWGGVGHAPSFVHLFCCVCSPYTEKKNVTPFTRNAKERTRLRKKKKKKKHPTNKSK